MREMLINSNKTQDLVLSGNIYLTYKTNAHSEITFEWGGVAPHVHAFSETFWFLYFWSKISDRETHINMGQVKYSRVHRNIQVIVNIEIYETTCSREASEDVSPCDWFIVM